MLAKRLIFAVVSLSLVGCVSNINRSLPPESKRIKLEGFSVSTPSERGWHIVVMKKASMHLAASGNNKDETYAIQAWGVALPIFKSNADFSSFIAKQITSDSDDARFKKQRLKAYPVKTEHGVCVKFEIITEDHGAVKRSSNTDPMLLEVEGITCRNPAIPSRAAHLMYSHRYYKGDRDLSFSKKAGKFISSLKF